MSGSAPSELVRMARIAAAVFAAGAAVVIAIAVIGDDDPAGPACDAATARPLGPAPAGFEYRRLSRRDLDRVLRQAPQGAEQADAFEFLELRRGERRVATLALRVVGSDEAARREYLDGFESSSAAAGATVTEGSFSGRPSATAVGEGVATMVAFSECHAVAVSASSSGRAAELAEALIAR